MVEYRRNTAVAIILYLVATVALILMSGCDCFRGSVQPGPDHTPVQVLAATLTWAGGLAGVLGLVLGFASWMPAGFLGPAGIIVAIASPFARLIGYVGGAVFLSGWGISYLGSHPWVVAIACLAAGLAWYFHRHPAVGGRLVGWLKDRTKARK